MMMMAAYLSLYTASNNNRRRRRRPSSHKNAAADRTIEIISDVGSKSLLPTPNDNFFEYQRRNGYEILLWNQQTNDLLHQLKEVHINNAIIHYLQQYHINSNNSMMTMAQHRIYNNNA